MSEPECVLITDDYLPHIGGSRIYYSNVAQMLAGRLGIVTRERGGSEVFDRDLSYPIRRIRLSSLSEGAAAVQDAANAVTLALEAMRAFPHTRFFLAGEVCPTAFSAYLAARRRRGSYGIILHDEPMAGAGRLEARLRKWVVARAAVLATSAVFAQQRCRGLAGESAPIIHAPPGVDLDTFRPGPAGRGVLARLGLEGRRYLLSAGRLVAYKNVSALISAIADPALAGLGLAVVGEGPERQALEAHAHEIGVSGRVVFAGQVKSGELAALYRGAFAYVFPSRRARGRQQEGIGMAALEAAACGCPVIASIFTSATDFIENGRTGLLFDPDVKGALEGAIASLLASADFRDAIASAGMERVRARYNWQSTAKAIGQAIDHLAGRHTHPS